MSKELEALNKLFVLSSEYHHKLWCVKLAPVYPEAREKYIDRIVECLPNDGGELNDLYNYIKQALKRNEPMKPITCKDSFGLCPCCKEDLGHKDFCPNCGQKLDWEEK